MLLTGSTLDEIKIDTLCLFYTDPRLIYIKGSELVRELISFIDSTSPVSLQEYKQAEDEINARIKALKAYKQTFTSLLMDDDQVEKRLDDLYESSFLLNRDSFLLTGVVKTKATEDTRCKMETPYGPFTKSQLSNSYIGNRYIGINQSNEVVRAEDIVDLVGGTAQKELLFEGLGSVSISSSSDGVTVSGEEYSYPLVVQIRPKVTGSTTEIAIPTGVTASLPSEIAPTSIVSLYREKVISIPPDRATGPLFIKKSNTFFLEEGSVFKGDVIIDKETLTAVTVVSSLGGKVRSSVPITLSEVECICSLYGLWEILISNIREIKLPSSNFEPSYSAQVQDLVRVMDASPLLTYQEENLSEKLLKIKLAHERVSATQALFYLDSCRINEYKSIQSESILNVESNSINEIRKFGI
tara:strand:+ start:9331 stop:10566 length:1236 start_codon:yes stop_codon:yes gene_type:complete